MIYFLYYVLHSQIMQKRLCADCAEEMHKVKIRFCKISIGNRSGAEACKMTTLLFNNTFSLCSHMHISAV